MLPVGTTGTSGVRVCPSLRRMIEPLPYSFSMVATARSMALLRFLSSMKRLRSDIDLAVEGLPRDDLFHAMGELLAVAPVSVDLVRIEEAPPGLVRRVRIEGRLIHG
jgi:hypothetical protein